MGMAVFTFCPNSGLGDRMVTTPFSRFVLIKSFLGGDAKRAESIGITFSTAEKVAAGTALAVITAKTLFYTYGQKVPGLAGWVDRRLNSRIAHLLDSYGHADFVTDADQYKLAA